MAQPNIRPDQIPPGALLTYYADLASGAVRPEDIRIEDLTFQAIIDPSGQVIQQTPAYNVVSTYTLALRRVYGQIVNPIMAGAAAGLIRFNLREQGRSFDVWKQPVSFATTLGSGGLSHDGVYMCVPGTQLEAVWTVDTTLWAALVGATRIVSITASGDYIRCGPSAR